MSKDIRSYFFKVNGSGNKIKEPEEVTKKNKKRPLKVIESDPEDDDVIFCTPKSKKQKESSSGQKPKKKTDLKEEKLKPVSLDSVFGKSPVQQKPQTIIKAVERKTETKTEKTSSKDRKSKSKKDTKQGKKKHEQKDLIELSFEGDDDFEATLLQIDDEKLQELSSNANTPQKADKKSPLKEDKTVKQNEIKKNDSDKNKTPKKEETLQIAVQNTTPVNADPKIGRTGLPDSDQKRKNAEFYQRYLQRSGPKHPGSKKIPKGSPTCLQGKTFVITGVLDSMEKDEAKDLIQRCGGRVTSAVSKKTNYLIVGDDAGTSKLEKAENFKTAKLTEDELLDLIRIKSGEAIECDSSQDIIEASPVKVKEQDSKYFKSEKSQKRTQKSNGIGEDNKKQKLDPSVNFKQKKEREEVGSLKLNDSGIGSSGPDSQTDWSQPGPTEYNLGDMLWVDKYKPRATKQIIGQNGDKSNVKKLTKWLQDWHKNHSQVNSKKAARPAPWAQNNDGSYFKAALLSGPPGVGKTTSVHLICQELGLDIVEFNASDTRSKRLLHEDVAELLSTKSIRGFFSGNSNKNMQHVLVMDEVDGMAGNEDRGGIQELIQLIKGTRIPVICMCNDRSHPKMRSLVNYCFDLRFSRPRVEQIKAAMMSICFKEGIKMPAGALEEMISSSNQDIRQVLHNLSMWAVRDKNATLEQVKVDAAKSKKPLNLGPWDVARKVFSKSDHDGMTLREKEELFFQDYSLGPLFVQDTYLRVKPYKANNDKKKTLELLWEAADSLAWGDVIERTIRSENAWGLLPVQAIFSSVIPGHAMEGHVQGQIQFPVWLGKNSKKNKCDRLLQELQMHMRLSITGSKEAVNLDYLTPLRDAIVQPLKNEGLDGVPKTLSILKDYNLMREDIDSIMELTQWPGSKDVFGEVDSKVKAALTRAYNKEVKATPYATNVAVKKVSSTADVEFGEDEEVDVEDDNIDLDAMIKKGKQKKVKVEREAGTSKAKKDKDGATSKPKKEKAPRKGKEKGKK